MQIKLMLDGDFLVAQLWESDPQGDVFHSEAALSLLDLHNALEGAEARRCCNIARNGKPYEPQRNRSIGS
jgi:hypothetical protein